MKNKLLMLIFSVMLISPAALVRASSEPVFFDFEKYTQDHTSPEGWPSSNTWELGPGKVDEAHGTSFKVLYKGIPAYKFAEPISKGEFLISFEIYFEDFDQNLRIHAKSPASGKDSHSLMQFAGGEVKCANTSEGAWVFDKMTELETHRWYQIDMLFNMDTGKLYYYVDGIEYAVKQIAFSDMSHIYFRTESGKNNNAVLYLDNVSFKYKSAGGFSSEFKNGIAEIGKQDVILNFMDLVSPDTIESIKMYNMGNDPFSYSENEIDIQSEMAGVKSVRLLLPEPLEKNTIYKVCAPETKTIFGDSLTNDTIYFATGGASTERITINADFSTIEETGNRKPINPTSDIEWTKSISNRINPVKTENSDGEEIVAVRFVQNKGTDDNKENVVTLTREISQGYEGKISMEIMLRAKNGKQVFRLKDSEGNEADLIKIIGHEVLVNETAVAEINEDTWYKFNVNIDTALSDITVRLNTEEIYSGSFSGLADVKEIIFEQRNLEETYGTAVATEDLAEMYIAYFRLYAQEECTSLGLVSFEDLNGNLHYPDGEIPTDITKVNFVFTDELNPNTLDDGIILSNENGVVSNEYEYSDGVYSILVPDYLNGMADYLINIEDTIKDENNRPIMKQSGSVTTDGGMFIGKNFTFDKLEDGDYIINAELIHTDSSCKDVYIAFAAYKGNLMIDYKLDIISPETDYRKIEFSNTYEKNEEADKIIAYLWDGSDLMNPFLRAQIIQ